MNKSLLEKMFEKATWTITKYANDEDYKAGKSYEIVKFEDNCLVNTGINHLNTIIATDAKTGTPFSNANAILIVGTGTPVGTAAPAAAAADTIATFTTPVGDVMEATFPTYGTNQKITWKSSFGATEANQDWCEFGVMTSTPIASGVLLNRKVSDQGIKVVDQTWELSLEITLS